MKKSVKETVKIIMKRTRRTLKPRSPSNISGVPPPKKKKSVKRQTLTLPLLDHPPALSVSGSVCSKAPIRESPSLPCDKCGNYFGRS